MENKPWVETLIQEVQGKIQELNIYASKLTHEIHEQYDRDIQKVPASVLE